MTTDITRPPKRISARVIFLLVFLFLIIGSSLRSYHLGDLQNIEADERAFVMAGTSIIRYGVPTSWTIPWPDLKWESYWKIEGNVVTPFLAHPPLFYTGVGLWAHLVDQRDYLKPDWLLLRLPMIAISGLTMLLTYLFVQRAFGSKLAIFTLAAYTFFPSDVVTARFVLPENTIPLFLMASLYLMTLQTTTKEATAKRWPVILLILIAGLAPLLKLSGLLVPGTVALFYFIRQNFRLGSLVIASTLCSLGFYLIFAWAYGWDIFVGSQTAHLTRPQTFEHIWTFFTKLDIGHLPFFDPSIIVGLIGIIILARFDRDNIGQLALFSTLITASFIFLNLAPVEAYGWYKYTLYPIMAIGLGYIFWQLYLGKYQYLFLFLPLLAVMIEHSQIFAALLHRKLLLTIIYVVALAPLIAPQVAKAKLRLVFLALLALLFIFETLWVLQFLSQT